MQELIIDDAFRTAITIAVIAGLIIYITRKKARVRRAEIKNFTRRVDKKKSREAVLLQVKKNPHVSGSGELQKRAWEPSNKNPGFNKYILCTSVIIHNVITHYIALLPFVKSAFLTRIAPN